MQRADVGRGVQGQLSLCDLNGHINNAYYLDLACDALPPEVLQAGPVTFAAVNYHREIPMGDTVELLYAPSEEGGMCRAATTAAPALSAI